MNVNTQRGTMAGIEATIYNHLRYIPGKSRDELIKTLCMTLLEVSHPLGGGGVSNDEYKTAIETRALRAARVLGRMARYQESTSHKFLSAWAFPRTKEYLWREVLTGWRVTENASVEGYLAGVLSGAYIVPDDENYKKEEWDAIQKVTRDALEKCRDGGRIKRLLSLCAEGNGRCITHVLAHRLVNLTRSTAIAGMFGLTKLRVVAS